MANCDLCGKRNVSLVTVELEGTRMEVCNSCSSSGKKIIPARPKKRFSSMNKREEPEILVVPDIGTRIKNAREKKGITQEELAKNLSEKVSLIQHIETGKLTPRLSTARKLEKFFGLTLTEVLKETNEAASQTQKGETLTFGDILSQAMNKKKD